MDKKYPIKATWEAVDSAGSIATIWLDRMIEDTEIWYWTFEFKDHSGYKGDWGTNYRSCFDQVSGKLLAENGKRPRFKRVR